jgi:hypothetical protein
MTLDIISLLIGIVIGGVACAISAKVFGWFQKETASVEKKV